MSHNQNYLATTVAIYRSDIDYSKEIKSPCLKVRESPYCKPEIKKPVG
jgi:hypothetical protein